MHSDPATQPTFTYRGQRFLWGYSPDRLVCGLWEVGDAAGLAQRTWPISEHEAAWGVFRSMEPHAVAYEEPVQVQTAVASAVSHPAPVASPSTQAANGNHPPALRVEASTSAPEAAIWADFSSGSGATPSESADRPADPNSRRRRLVLVGALCAVLVLAVVVGVNKLLPKPAVISPAQVVLTAATSTQSLHSAHMSMTETISDRAASKTITVPATGEVDFSTGEASVMMTVEGERLSVVSAGGTLYMSIPQIAQAIPGKSWVSVPLDNAGSAEGGVLSGDDPTQMLQLLASQGNLVSSLGPSTVDGASVQGYSVLINKAAVESELGSSGVPSSEVEAADQFLKAVGPIIYKVYVDSDNQLKAMDFSMAVPGESGFSASAQVIFSDYGAPVTLSAPQASQVATLQQFLSAVQ